MRKLPVVTEDEAMTSSMSGGSFKPDPGSLLMSSPFDPMDSECNEVRLAAAGGVLFLSFPRTYTAAFSGLYLASSVVLLASPAGCTSLRRLRKIGTFARRPRPPC